MRAGILNSTIKTQFTGRKITGNGLVSGIYRFLVGFNKKMLLANTFAVIADEAFGMKDPSVTMAWLGALSYTLQIFFDFSGYSDMAIGLGKMMGFEFPENFNYPYISRSITDVLLESAETARAGCGSAVCDLLREKEISASCVVKENLPRHK